MATKGVLRFPADLYTSEIKFGLGSVGCQLGLERTKIIILTFFVKMAFIWKKKVVEKSVFFFFFKEAEKNRLYRKVIDSVGSNRSHNRTNV